MKNDDVYQAVKNLSEIFSDEKNEIRASLKLLCSSLEDTKAVFEGNKLQELKFEAHKIKGDLSMCGFTHLGSIAAELEELAGRKVRDEKRIKDFNHQASLLIKDIQEWLSKEH